jgi:CRP-like cAMP-binding protein
VLRARDTLFHPGDDVELIHFPAGATVVSLVSVLADGRGAEAATIGREGAVGGIVSGGKMPAFARAAVQIGGPALRLPAARLEAAKASSPVIRDVFARYADCLVAQLQQSVVCNAIHPLEARLGRWLLTTQDRVGAGELPLTHDAMAEMLGARRSTVTPVAGALAQRGLIAYRRGRVRVLDRAGLEAAACECHGAVRRHFERVAPGLYPAGEEG